MEHAEYMSYVYFIKLLTKERFPSMNLSLEVAQKQILHNRNINIVLVRLLATLLDERRWDLRENSPSSTTRDSLVQLCDQILRNRESNRECAENAKSLCEEAIVAYKHGNEHDVYTSYSRLHNYHQEHEKTEYSEIAVYVKIL